MVKESRERMEALLTSKEEDKLKIKPLKRKQSINFKESLTSLPKMKAKGNSLSKLLHQKNKSELTLPTLSSSILNRSMKQPKSKNLNKSISSCLIYREADIDKSRFYNNSFVSETKSTAVDEFYINSLIDLPESKLPKVMPRRPSNTKDSLKYIQNIFAAQHDSNMNMLLSKVKELELASNATADRIRKLQKEKNLLQDHLKDLLANEFNADSSEKDELILKHEKLKEQIEEAKVSETHMGRLLSICEINSIMNFDASNPLVVYTKNLNQVIKEIKKNISNMVSEDEDLEIDAQNLIYNYNIRKGVHSNEINKAEITIKENAYIEELIDFTNTLVKDAVVMDQKDIKLELENQVHQDRVAMEKINTRKQQKITKAKLAKMRKIYIKNKILFEEIKQDNSISPHLYDTIEQIRKSKELEAYLFRLKFEVKQHEQEIEHLAKQKKLIDSANEREKGVDHLNDTTQRLKQEQSLIIKSMEREKQRIKDANELLERSIVVDCDSNFAVSSIANHLGHYIHNEAEILSNSDEVFKIVQSIGDIIHDLQSKLSSSELESLIKFDKTIFYNTVNRKYCELKVQEEEQDIKENSSEDASFN